jgi:hypothetical protein
MEGKGKEATARRGEQAVHKAEVEFRFVGQETLFNKPEVEFRFGGVFRARRMFFTPRRRRNRGERADNGEVWRREVREFCPCQERAERWGTRGEAGDRVIGTLKPGAHEGPPIVGSDGAFVRTVHGRKRVKYLLGQVLT